MTQNKACVCGVGSIRYQHPATGELATAPVAYRCAEHGPAERASQRTRDAAVASLWRGMRRALPLALPAPDTLTC